MRRGISNALPQCCTNAEKSDKRLYKSHIFPITVFIFYHFPLYYKEKRGSFHSLANGPYF